MIEKTNVSRIVASPLEAVVTVSVAKPALRTAITDALARAFRAEAIVPVARERVIRLRTRRRLHELGERLATSIVVIPVTMTNARHLVEMAHVARTGGAAGVQIVWDGEAPPRVAIEQHVFAVLERARATPALPPVVLAKTMDLVPALVLLVEHRERARSTPTEQSEARV